MDTCHTSPVPGQEGNTVAAFRMDSASPALEVRGCQTSSSWNGLMMSTGTTLRASAATATVTMVVATVKIADAETAGTLPVLGTGFDRTVGRGSRYVAASQTLPRPLPAKCTAPPCTMTGLVRYAGTCRFRCRSRCLRILSCWSCWSCCFGRSCCSSACRRPAGGRRVRPSQNSNSS